MINIVSYNDIFLDGETPPMAKIVILSGEFPPTEPKKHK